MSETIKPYAMLCFKCPHCGGLIDAELFKAKTVGRAKRI